MAVTEQEKVKIRHHLGYLNVAEASTFVLGTPAGVETQFIIEGAMNRVLEAALPEMRRQLNILDALEEQMVADFELIAVLKLGEIDINQKEQKQLKQNYNYWVNSLANVFGITRNPYDKRLMGIGANAGMNMTVQH